MFWHLLVRRNTGHLYTVCFCQTWTRELEHCNTCVTDIEVGNYQRLWGFHIGFANQVARSMVMMLVAKLVLSVALRHSWKAAPLVYYNYTHHILKSMFCRLLFWNERDQFRVVLWNERCWVGLLWNSKSHVRTHACAVGSGFTVILGFIGIA